MDRLLAVLTLLLTFKGLEISQARLELEQQKLNNEEGVSNE